MRRRFVVLLATLALTLGVPGAMQPAEAFHNDACAGFGFASVGTPHGYMALGSPSVSTGFAVNMVFGTCASGISFWASGTLEGWCESTTGSGVTSTGHEFTITGSGYSFVLAGEVIGTMKFYAESTGLPCQPEIGTSYRATTDVVLLEHPL